MSYTWDKGIVFDAITALRKRRESSVADLAEKTGHTHERMARALKYAESKGRVMRCRWEKTEARGPKKPIYCVTDQVQYTGPAANSVWQYAAAMNR